MWPVSIDKIIHTNVLLGLLNIFFVELSEKEVASLLTSNLTKTTTYNYLTENREFAKNAWKNKQQYNEIYLALIQLDIAPLQGSEGEIVQRGHICSCVNCERLASRRTL